VRVRKIRAEMEEQRSATRRKTAVYAQQNYSLAQTRTGDSHSKPSWRGLESTPKCQSWLNWRTPEVPGELNGVLALEPERDRAHIADDSDSW